MKLEYEDRILPGINVHDLRYDDFSIRPGYTDFNFEDIDTSSKLTRRIHLKIPIASAPMDTVTESDLAIALALEGGFGFIHYNFKDLGRIIEELCKVKKFESGFVEDPIVLSPCDLVDEAARIRREKGISTIPITENGKPDGKLVGILTKDDYSMLKHGGVMVKDRMTPSERLVTVKWSEMPNDPQRRLSYANDVLLESHLGTLPVVEDNGNLKYLVTRSDLEKNEQYPLATKDTKKRLRTGIAIATREEFKEIIQEAVRIGVDAIVIDSAHGDTKRQVEWVEYLKNSFDVDVVAGSISMPEAAIRLIEAGADALRVNTSSGSICTSEETLSIGCPQGTAVYFCSLAARRYAGEHNTEPVPIIADGDLKKSGDIVKALALCGTTVKTGSLLAGCDEAPGWRIDEKNGRRVKIYRGMGSASAMEIRGDARYLGSRVPEGIEKTVGGTGSVHKWVPEMVKILRQSMERLGARTIPDLLKTKIGPPAHRQKKEEEYGSIPYQQEGS